MPDLVWLDEVREDDRARVGSKAFHLARLRQAGFAVPDGFVLPDGLPGDPAALRAALARLGGPVAVRSSSAAEDTAEASFAGQYRTDLALDGEEAVAAAVARCRAATAGAGAYADALAAGRSAPPAVLVQRFVEPRAAGVVFTRDPRDPGALLVEAHAGRGEALVSGAVTPDRWVLDRETRAVREAPPDGGALAADELAALAGLALGAEALFGGAQDVEWASGAFGLVLLQSRPITVETEEARDPRVRRLTRANVGEVLPDPVTPLTATTVMALLEHAFRTVAARAGLDGHEGADFLVLHHQRVYLNLSRALDVAARLPGVTHEDAERLVLGGGAGVPPPAPGPRAWPRLVRVGAHLLGLAYVLDRELAAAEAALGRARAHRAAPDEALTAALDDVLDAGRTIAVTHVLVSGASAVRLALLSRLVAGASPGDPAARVNRLMAALDGVESAEPAVALEALAAEVREDRAARALLARGAEEAARGFRLGALPAAVRAGLTAFLDRFGHRGLSEGELAARSWREDPRPVFDALAALAVGEAPRGLHFRAAAEARRAEEEAVLFRAGALRRALLRRAIAAARDGVRAREHTKSVAIALVDEVRRLVRRAGALLAARGALAASEEVVLLTRAELRAALEGTPVSRALLARRRRRLARAAALPAPRDVDLDAPGEERPDAMRWRGVGVSAGVGAGPARVASAGVLPRLARGEVLVAPVLDAAMGPALTAAAGAVIEIGGVLSHGAVVARELGIPCVVDVRGATAAIRDGERILVDGGTGEVRRLEEPAADAAPAPAEPSLPEADAAEEAFHVLDDHPRARESVYVNAQDAAAGLCLVASAGVRKGARGEALLAIGLPDGRILFGLELARARVRGAAIRVGPFEAEGAPASLRFDGRLSVHEPEGFPPGAVPLLLAPRTAEVRLELRLAPKTPAIEFAGTLPEDQRALLAPLGANHVEQSGLWTGRLDVSGRTWEFAGTGSRDHSWGRREWDAAEWWRLFTFRLGDDLAVHALSVQVEGRRVDGGFLWRDGRAVRLARVLYAPRPDGSAFDLELAPADGPPLRVVGRVRRTLTVPVDPERRLGPHLAGRPWRLRLHENFADYEGEGRRGQGMAEITARAT